MRTLPYLFLMMVFAATALQAQSATIPASFAGTWNGTYQGDGAGSFVLTLADDGSSVRVKQNDGNFYTVPLTVSFERDALTAEGVIPGSASQVSLEGTLSDDGLSGHWSTQDSSGSAAQGTWVAQPTP
ncbi:hypothetical protein [Catalinimonas alkaloidigena]|nr:hypothetical protein [Catalinimonas alkaloidigena]